MVNLLEGEKIVLTKRRHWFVIASEGALFFLLGIAPFAGLIALSSFFPQVAFSPQDYSIFILFYGAAWLLFLWLLFSIAWTNYYMDVLLVTNKRVIDIEQFSLFARDLVELRLENVQDIKVEIIGLIPSLLQMGDLHIQTAGNAREVLLKNIADPDEVKNIISLYQNNLVKEKPAPIA